jgi:hypothetical protein
MKRPNHKNVGTSQRFTAHAAARRAADKSTAAHDQRFQNSFAQAGAPFVITEEYTMPDLGPIAGFKPVVRTL